MLVSPKVTVKLNSLSALGALPAIVLVTMSLPYVSLVFVKAAVTVSSPAIVPVSPVFVVT